MNAPHHTIRARSPANILADLKEARRDVDDALADLGNSLSRGQEEADADDRATEAETRVEDLRAEFDVKLAETTGLTVEQLRSAYEQALI